MTEVFSLANLILSNADRLSLFIMAVALIVAFYIAIANYKREVWEYITNRRNKWWFIYALLVLAAIIVLRSQSVLYGYWLIIVSSLWLIYVIVCFRSLKPKSFASYSSPILRRYMQRLYDGYTIEYIEYFRRKTPWYLWTVEDKLEYHLLASQYYESVNEFDRGFQELKKIKADWLYKCESELISLQKALLLIQMGSMKPALQLLGDPNKNESKDPMAWFVYSYIFENAGDIDKALLYAEKSRDIVDVSGNAYDIKAAQIYNNYSRIAHIKGNRLEALQYINKSWEHVRTSKNLSLVHLVAMNRIMQMALIGRSQDECNDAIKAYKECIKNTSIMNIVGFNNCLIGYYRQINDSRNEYSLIKSGYIDIIDSLNDTQKAIYTVSTFMMLMNGHFKHKWFDKYVKMGSKYFESLPLMEKLDVCNKYMSIFQQEEFRVICNSQPYSGLRKKIMKYYQERAIDDIEEELKKTESYDTYRYMNLVRMKLFILVLLEGKHHIEQSKGIYIDLYHHLYDAGLHIESVHVLLDLLNESLSPNNTLVLRPDWSEAKYLYDFLNQTYPIPEPTLSQDGMHLNYYRIQIAEPFAIKYLKIDIIKEYIDLLITNFHSWKNHPFKNELSIQIADFLVCLNRKEEAREFYEFYKNYGVSDNQMSAVFRDKILNIESALLES